MPASHEATKPLILLIVTAIIARSVSTYLQVQYNCIINIITGHSSYLGR